jgi:hypothetical protein
VRVSPPSSVDPLTGSHDRDSPRRLTLFELEQHLWGAANILRAPIDQADFKSYIFPVLFFKRISDAWDEEYAQALEESDGDFDYASFAENHRRSRSHGQHEARVVLTDRDAGGMVVTRPASRRASPGQLRHPSTGQFEWMRQVE